jgi:hypothetical protein
MSILQGNHPDPVFGDYGYNAPLIPTYGDNIFEDRGLGASTPNIASTPTDSTWVAVPPQYIRRYNEGLFQPKYPQLYNGSGGWITLDESDYRRDAWWEFFEFKPENVSVRVSSKTINALIGLGLVKGTSSQIADAQKENKAFADRQIAVETGKSSPIVAGLTGSLVTVILIGAGAFLVVKYA